MERNKHARNTIFNRIRGTVNPFLLQTAAVRERERERDLARIPREFLRGGKLNTPDRIALFRDRLAYYGASSELARRDGIAERIGAMLGTRNKKRIAIPDALPQEWIPDGFDMVRDSGLTNHELDSIDGVLTGCTVAIALTGTVILASRGDNGRRAVTLVPDYQLCVVMENQIFELFPDAIEALQPYKELPLTFFSGPSATVDIEMTRVKGVHGPRTLDVIIVSET